jgi:transposase-like protein
MTKAVARDPIYRRRRFQSETIELCVRWYLTYRFSYRSRGNDSRARRHGIAFDHTEVGSTVRAGIREPVGSLRAAHPFIVEDGRNCGFGAGRSLLPVSGRR